MIGVDVDEERRRGGGDVVIGLQSQGREGR